MKNGMKLQVNTRAGYAYGQNEVEPMLPTGFTLQANGKVETPNERIKRKTMKQENKAGQKVEHNHLLPNGVTLRG